VVISIGIRAHPSVDIRVQKQNKWEELHHGIPNFDAPTTHDTVDHRSNERYRPDIGN
jgi:hypothetical protein